MVELWLQIATVGMGVGVILLFFAMQKNTTQDEREDSISHFFVPLVALSLYLLMALGYGKMHLASGRDFYWARYIDWSITTPLLLLSLVSGAVANRVRKPVGMIAGLLGADVYMILTGLVAGLTDNVILKWSFYALSCLAFLAIYGLLFGAFKQMSLDSPRGDDYRKKALVLSVIWFAYPIVFLFGQEGLRTWSAGMDSLLFACLDVSAKVGYGLWAVWLARQKGATMASEPVVPSTSGAWTPAR
jgi:bacteriorhodopsin